MPDKPCVGWEPLQDACRGPPRAWPVLQLEALALLALLDLVPRLPVLAAASQGGQWGPPNSS